MNNASALLLGVMAGLKQNNGSLTREQAIELYDSKIWVQWSNEEIVKLQLYQDCLCLPFGRFHEAAEKVLGRPVWTHEFAFADRLREEYESKAPKPTFEDIVGLIPEDKLVIIVVDDRVKGEANVQRSNADSEGNLHRVC